MKFIKNKFWYSTYLSFALFHNPCLPVEEKSSSFELEQESQSISFQADDQCPPTDQDIITLLLLINAPAALQGDLYKRTNPPNMRSIHSLPLLQPYVDTQANWSIGAQLFVNITYKMFFTKCSPFIKSSLAFENSDFIEKIDLSLFSNVSIPEILPLFSQIKLQERRSGLLLSAIKNYPLWTFLAVLPVYYLEHNFFLTDSEIDAISDDPLFQSISASTDNTQAERFFTCHLVNDAAGIGDLRLTGVYYFNECYKKDFLLGLDLIFPTAKAIKQGIIGNKFPINEPIPPFSIRDVTSLACLNQTSLAFDEVTNFLIGALDRLTTNVAHSNLGTGFFSIEPFMQYEYDLSKSLNLNTYFKVAYYVPRTRTRFFLKKYTPEQFNRDYENPALATENLDFLNQAFIDTLYTHSLSLKVKPGFYVRITPFITWELKNVSMAVGYDFWYKSAEKFGSVSTLIRQNFNLPKGLKSSANQSRLFGYIFAHHNHDGADSWHVGIRGDATIAHTGIGNDFTVTLDGIFDF